ncbi:MAG: 50S ribosomal protein L3 [Pseudomonadales bacterium]
MATGIVGQKLGMTRVFDEAGASTPVTVIGVEANRVTQVKSKEVDGYDAIQVTTGTCGNSAISRPLMGHFSKANSEAGRGLWEFRLDNPAEELVVGKELTLDQFFEGQIVDVTGTSKGKGFAGGIKRWNFRHQDYTHGNSISHRAPGSIGQCQTPGRVFKGKKMAGHLGNVQVTTQNLVVVRVDRERNFLLVKGAVPGHEGGDVIVVPGVKAGTQNPSTSPEARVDEGVTT